MLTILYQSNATEVVTKMLIRMVKINEKGKQKIGLSNHSIICSFWILSALAAKGKIYNIWYQFLQYFSTSANALKLCVPNVMVFHTHTEIHEMVGRALLMKMCVNRQACYCHV